MKEVKKKSKILSFCLPTHSKFCVNERSLCELTILVAEVTGYKGDGPRQECQLTKAAQHESVRLGKRSALKSPSPAGVSMKVSISLTPPSPGSMQRHLKHAHIFKGD